VDGAVLLDVLADELLFPFDVLVLPFLELLFTVVLSLRTLSRPLLFAIALVRASRVLYTFLFITTVLFLTITWLRGTK
jgi:hypothetical protein